MKRWVFNISAGVSLVFCVAAIVLWVRSYFVCDFLQYHSDGNRRYDVVAYLPRGAIEVYAYRADLRSRRAPRTIFAHETGRPSGPLRSQDVVFDLAGFRCTFAHESMFSNSGYGFVNIGVVVPLWFLTILAAVLPIVWYRRWQRRRLQVDLAGTYCTQCGYDLRATPDRCPECGAVVSKTSDA